MPTSHRACGKEKPAVCPHQPRFTVKSPLPSPPQPHVQVARARGEFWWPHAQPTVRVGGAGLGCVPRASILPHTGVFMAGSSDAQPRASRTLSITVEPHGASHPESFLKETPNFQHLLKVLQAALLPADVSSC